MFIDKKNMIDFFFIKDDPLIFLTKSNNRQSNQILLVTPITCQ